MSDITRFTVSIESELLDSFDRLITSRGYTNRSEAIRDAIRRQLISREWEDGEEVAGVITLLYDHHRPGLSEELTEIQHHAIPSVISTTHIHLDAQNCLEFIAVRGSGGTIESLADRLKSLRGVKHGELTATSTGKKIV